MLKRAADSSCYAATATAARGTCLIGSRATFRPDAVKSARTAAHGAYRSVHAPSASFSRRDARACRFF
jgi:hypothetical protein